MVIQAPAASSDLRQQAHYLLPHGFLLENKLLLKRENRIYPLWDISSSRSNLLKCYYSVFPRNSQSNLKCISFEKHGEKIFWPYAGGMRNTEFRKIVTRL